MTTTEIIIIANLVAIQIGLYEIKRRLQEAKRTTAKALSNVSHALKEITKYVNHSSETEANTIRVLTEMCNAINQSFGTSEAFMNHTTCALQNIATCMIPFVDEVKQRAIKNEEYEKAQECVNIIKNLTELIKANK